MNDWVIVSLTETSDDATPLYWNNTDGWVAREHADRFPDPCVNLPDDGVWVSA